MSNTGYYGWQNDYFDDEPIYMEDEMTFLQAFRGWLRMLWLTRPRRETCTDCRITYWKYYDGDLQYGFCPGNKCVPF